MFRGEPVSVAPMMDRTDRHFRFLLRGITSRTLLYTEMVTTPAVLRGDRKRVLGYAPVEHPLALQLGGDDPRALAECAAIGEDLGYDEINLNVGCPSDRVQSGAFGAALMRRPERVAECVASMKARVRVPVTVKHRIGVDELDLYEDMLNFVDVVAPSGPARFSVHARKAWLRGLSPKQNRTVPPLRHAEVARLKRERPQLWVETNGGIRSLDQIAEHLEAVDGVMLGRIAWDDPMMLDRVDARFFEDAHAQGTADREPTTRRAVVEHYLPHLASELARGRSPTLLVRVLLNLFVGRWGSKRWKRQLGALARRPDSIVTELPRVLSELEADGAAARLAPTPPVHTA